MDCFFFLMFTACVFFSFLSKNKGKVSFFSGDAKIGLYTFTFK